MKSFSQKDAELNLDDLSQLYEWSNKWNISMNDLTRAIVETGSVNIKHLKAHINKPDGESIIWMYQGIRIIR